MPTSSNNSSLKSSCKSLSTLSQKSETVAVVSPFSTTVALFCDSLTFVRQSDFSATVWTGLKSLAERHSASNQGSVSDGEWPAWAVQKCHPTQWKHRRHKVAPSHQLNAQSTDLVNREAMSRWQKSGDARTASILTVRHGQNSTVVTGAVTRRPSTVLLKISISRLS